MPTNAQERERGSVNADGGTGADGGAGADCGADARYRNRNVAA